MGAKRRPKGKKKRTSKSHKAERRRNSSIRRRGGRNNKARGSQGKSNSQGKNKGRNVEKNLRDLSAANDIPDSLSGGVVVVDEDEFYGLTIDLILYNFSKDSAVKVCGVNSSKKLGGLIRQGVYQDNIYIIEDIFLEDKLDMKEVVDTIKKIDKGSTIILTTLFDGASVRPEIEEVVDHVVVKSRKKKESSIVKTLAEILGEEYIEDNSDPEYNSLG